MALAAAEWGLRLLRGVPRCLARRISVARARDRTVKIEDCQVNVNLSLLDGREPGGMATHACNSQIAILPRAGKRTARSSLFEFRGRRRAFARVAALRNSHGRKKKTRRDPSPQPQASAPSRARSTPKSEGRRCPCNAWRIQHRV